MKQMIRAAAPGLYETLSDTRQRLRDRLFPSSRTVTLQSGLRAEIRGFADRCMYDDIFVNGEYDRAIDLAVRGAAPGSVALDLGANVGYFGVRFADCWLQAHGPDADFLVVGFEGSPGNYAELMRRVDQPMLAGRCQYHRGLVGRRRGEAHMSAEAYHFKRAIVEAPTAASEAIPFLDVAERLPADRRVRLLKSNIEGAEGPFIEEYPDLLRRIDVAVIQFHHDRCDVPLALRRLADAGLAPVELRDRGINQQSYGIFANPAHAGHD
jgi:FkbM family methyltransferase